MVEPVGFERLLEGEMGEMVSPVEWARPDRPPRRSGSKGIR